MARSGEQSAVWQTALYGGFGVMVFMGVRFYRQPGNGPAMTAVGYGAVGLGLAGVALVALVGWRQSRRSGRQDDADDADDSRLTAEELIARAQKRRKRRSSDED